MVITQTHHEIFKKGSKTYFNSSIFFPEKVRSDIFILYGFVRVADDYVDTIPQDKEAFHQFCDRYRKAFNTGEKADDLVIDSFIDLIHRKNFDPEWVEAFLYSMELDHVKSEYNTLEETLEYIYGSAEVIGLFMAKILDTPEEWYPAAKMLGRAMQYINFIRDIKEDIKLGRRYLPLDGFKLKNLSPEEVMNNKEEFERFLRAQIDQYFEWQKDAEPGFKHMPRRYRIPIKTASDMYKWTGKQIQKNPLIVFEKKVKPSKGRIVSRVIYNSLFS